MKPEELSRFDGLVLLKMRKLLAALRKVSLTNDRRKILQLTSELDDADLNELSFALRRIEKGTYGHCVICRHDIPGAVLESNLTARLCPSCQLEIQETIENFASEGNTSI